MLYFFCQQKEEGKRAAMKTRNIATMYAILAAALYAVNAPISKLLLKHAGATMTAAFLYLGAGIGLLLYGGIERQVKGGKKQERLTQKELPYTAAMVVLDIAAPTDADGAHVPPKNRAVPDGHILPQGYVPDEGRALRRPGGGRDGGGLSCGCSYEHRLPPCKYRFCVGRRPRLRLQKAENTVSDFI